VGRPRIHDGLDLFFDWMVESGHRSPTTARTYTSQVRRIIRSVNKHISDPKTVREYFLSMHKEQPLQYSGLRSAWMAYREFAQTQGVELPPPPSSGEARLATLGIEPPPPEVRDAIRELHVCGISFQEMALVRWDHVDLAQMANAPTALVEVPTRPSGTEFWKVNSEPLRTLWDYGDVGGDLSLPVVPRKPGSAVPMTATMLGKEAKKYTEEQVQAMMQKPSRAGSLSDVMAFDPNVED
jgi:hypothetical protein